MFVLIVRYSIYLFSCPPAPFLRQTATLGRAISFKDLKFMEFQEVNANYLPYSFIRSR